MTIRLWLNRYMKSGVFGLMHNLTFGRPAQKAPLVVFGSSVEKKTVTTVNVRSSKTIFRALSLRTSRYHWKQ